MAAGLSCAAVLVLLLLIAAALGARRAWAADRFRARPGERLRWERDPWVSELRAKGRWPPSPGRALTGGAPIDREPSWWFGTASPDVAMPGLAGAQRSYAGYAAPLELSLPLRGFYAYLYDYPPPARMPYNA